MPCQVTRALIDTMQHPDSTKTYLALCDGDGTWNGIDYRDKGWFAIDTPVKDEYGRFGSIFMPLQVVSLLRLKQLFA
jgi:hypothetical protein